MIAYKGWHAVNTITIAMDFPVSHPRFLRMLLLLLGGGLFAARGCEVACYPPSGSSKTYNSSEERAIIEAQCYSACLEKYQDLVPPVSFIDYGKWRSVSYSVLESHSCGTFQRILECKSSCISRAYQNHQTTNICRNECFNRCRMECPKNENCTYYGSFTSCSRLCRRAACRIGCEEYRNSFGSNTTQPSGLLPDNPTLQLHLMPTSITGVYTVNELTTTVYMGGENASSSSNSVHPTSFIFRLEDNGEFHYFWQPSLSEQMQLSYYSCRKINISFAAVNIFGKSAYAPVNTACIEGEYHYPQQVSQLNFEYTEDLRSGFLSHAVVNISWEKPSGTNDWLFLQTTVVNFQREGALLHRAFTTIHFTSVICHRFEFLTDYDIIIVPTSIDCGDVIHITSIPKNETWITYAASQPGHPPRFSCRYHVKMYSKPSEPGIMPAKGEMRPRLMATAGDLYLTCQRVLHYNNTITVGLYWTMENSSVVMVAIERFDVDIHLVTVDSQVEATRVTSSQVPMKGNQDTYQYISGLLQTFIGVEMKYSITVTPIKNLSFYWRPIPQETECFINATIPPSPPNKVDKNSIKIQSTETGSFTATWTPPSLPYGNITVYEVMVGDQPVVEEAQEQQFYSLTVMGNITIVNLQASEIMEHSSCHFLQIRSHNGYAWSNWSDPLSLSNLHLDCKITSSSTSVPIATSHSPYNPSTTSPRDIHTVLPTMILFSPMQTQIFPPSGHVPMEVMYVVYGMSAFIGFLLLLSTGFLSVLVILRCTRIREDKVTSIEFDREASIMKKVTEETEKKETEAKRAEENIYEPCPIITGNNTGSTSVSNIVNDSTAV